MDCLRGLELGFIVLDVIQDYHFEFDAETHVDWRMHVGANVEGAENLNNVFGG